MTKTCEVCGVVFTPRPGNFNVAKCCSQKCNQKKWRRNNPEHNNRIKIEWRRKNGVVEKGSKQHRYKCAMGSRRVWAKSRRNISLKNADGWHSKVEWEELKSKCKYSCVCCKRTEPEIKLSKDHIVPLSRGGSNDITNIQPLCKSCNSKKHQNETNYLCQL